MSELQDLYETINPIPENMSRCGEGYCQHVYMLIDPYASGYTARFEGFKQGLKYRQTEVDELQKQKEILLNEIYLMNDAIQYHRILNLLKDGENDH